MKVFALLGCVAVSAFSQASFELVLAVDQTNHCIHRYDGDSGAYLGNFGGLRLDAAGYGPFGMALDQTRNKVYVGTNAGIKSFNYNTGEYLNTIQAPNGLNFGFSVFSNGDLLTNINTTVQRISSTTGALIQTFNLSAGGLQGTALSAAVDENDNVFIVDTITGSGTNNAKIDRFLGNGTYLSSTGFYTQRAVNNFQQMQARGGHLICGDDTTGHYTAMTYTAGSMGSPFQNFYSSDMTQTLGVAMGHGDIRYHSGPGPSGASRIVINTETGGPANILPTPQIPANAMRQICVVVAPEPGSLLGLGLGLLVISRRKK